MPSTWSIRKNGVPSTSPVFSSQRTRGTGTSVSSPARRITSNWWSNRYHGNTGMSASVGATRATHFCSLGEPSSVQRPVRMMVSEDIPLESTPLSTVMSGATPPGMTVDSHCDNTAGRAVTSLLERCRWSTFCTATFCSANSLVDGRFLATGSSFTTELRYGG